MNPERSSSLLDIQNLVTVFDTDEGPLRAVDNLSLRIHDGETLGLVGESGCGKSVTALSILRLLPQGIAKILGGDIHFKNQSLLQLPADEMRKIRGNRISMIFQDPMTSLNPVFKIGEQVAEAIRLHQGLNRAQAWQRSLEALKQVGIPDAESRMEQYPHQFSGGQRQRVMIAMALACRPALLIADEPTTALDVTIQAQILNLLRELRQRESMAILLITHDLAVVSEFASRVAIMYAGHLVEVAESVALFKQALHPYTVGLMKSLPAFSGEEPQAKRKPLYTISGVVPDLRHLPSGCRYSNRCPYVQRHCTLQEPALNEVEPGHWVRCWEWEKVRADGGRAACS